MTEGQSVSPQNFFDGAGISGAPSFKFQGVNSGVIGTIVDQFATVVKDPDTGEAKLDKNGREQPQLNVTLQTTLSGYVNVPIDPKTGEPRGSKNEDGSPREDDGTRRIYVKHKMRDAIGKALTAAGVTGGLQNGGTLGVKVVGFQDTGKMNPLPLYEATYTPPSPSNGFEFSGDDSDETVDASAPAAAANPWPTPAAQSAPAAPATTQAQTEEPPF